MNSRPTFLFTAVLLSISAPALPQDHGTYKEPAPTASGLQSEGKEDLSAQTSQPGSPNQSSWNLMSSLAGAELFGTEGEEIANLRDVIVDRSGRITHLVIEPSGLSGIGAERRLLEARELPAVDSDRLNVQLAKDELKGLPEYKPAELQDRWPASHLLSAEIDGTDGAEISDIRFTRDAVDRLIIDTGGSEGSNKVLEVAFADIRISGSAEEPDVAATDQTKQQLQTLKSDAR